MSRKLIFVYSLVLFLTLLLGIGLGSVKVPIINIIDFFQNWLLGEELTGQHDRIIYFVRLPRVLAAGFTGILLALSGAIMQGLLQNPLADGSTIGVSGGAALGATLAIVINFQVPFLAIGGTALMAILFSFLSILLIIGIVHVLDHSLSSYTIIVVGIIFSMFTSSLLSLILVFFNDDLKKIIFWTMGSLANVNYQSVGLLSVTALIGIVMTGRYTRELNILAIGTDQARNLGVSVAKIRLLLLFLASVMIGVAVSIGGSIAFVGLIIPHISRLMFGPDFQRLTPAVIFNGAIFLILTDLIARTIFRPIELPIGVLTSMVGSITFMVIFSKKRST